MRVLVAEDDRADQRMLQAALTKWGYEVELVGDGEAALEVLSSDDPPRLALLDWVMPLRDGPEVCRAVRELNGEPYVYVLLLTGRDRKEDVVAGMDAGADDYITKPWNAQELETRLRAGRRIIDLQCQLIETRDALRFQASHDALTGLWNRGAAMQALDREVSRAQREGTCLSVVIADLDRFKHVNDTYGHPTGDAVLREVGRRLQLCSRPYDIIGRYGGEEFIGILPGGDADVGGGIAERLRAHIADEPVITPTGPLNISGSFGVASRVMRSGIGGDELLRLADEAMYLVKARGGNDVETVVPEPAYAT